MIYDHNIPLSGYVELPDVCLPGDTKETYPPLILANLKKEYDEALKREESKKTRVVYFGERPPALKYDSLGQPIFMASTVDSHKNGLVATCKIFLLVSKGVVEKLKLIAIMYRAVRCGKVEINCNQH